MNPKLLNGDCLEVLKSLPDDSVDSVVTDPPYGISFMGKKWDYDVPSVEVFKEIMRVLKPGGHILCACGTRTQHRMAVNIEDAGFEIRDVITWLYGSGFPKSMDISKAIDKQAGAERRVVGRSAYSANRTKDIGYLGTGHSEPERLVTAPATEAAKQWQGWGTALKPACEFWTLARKPLSGKTVASNVLKHGTGGINIDGCRVEGAFESGWSKSGSKESENTSMRGKNYERPPKPDNPTGRWPANLILDEEAAEALDEQSGAVRSAGQYRGTRKLNPIGFLKGSHTEGWGYSDKGGASRFFYAAKASKGERGSENVHPTVKPIKLMTYLCRLITPPNGIVLDPFMGSGSTGVAAVKEGFGFIGIEREPQYFEICKARVESA